MKIVIKKVPPMVYTLIITYIYMYVLCIMYYVLYTMYYVLCTMYYVLCLIYVLCIMYYYVYNYAIYRDSGDSLSECYMGSQELPMIFP